ncbi:MAG: fasciclin domain-containing protein, partial [Salinibacter sp.]
MTTFLSRIFLFMLVGLAVLTAPVSAQQSDMADDGPTVVETAVQADDFTILAQALKAADLAGALQGDGPFTVFAPTDAAFEALPEGQLETLLKPENKAQLQAILKYHVV